MSKTLEKLIDKALKTGKANINGRMKDFGYIGELESKYKAHYNKDIDTLVVYHWGTCIVSIKGLPLRGKGKEKQRKIKQWKMYFTNHIKS